MFHEAMDIADPTIMAEWNDAEANLKSRMIFFTQAARDDTVTFAGHMGIGRIQRASSGYEWEAV